VPPRQRRLIPATGLAALLGLSSVLLWLAITAPQSGRLTVTLLDVGQGESILIEGPEGHRILVDGGPSSEAITSALGRHLPFYDRRIDLVVLTHPQADHLSGLPEVLERYHVGALLTNADRTNTGIYQAWSAAVATTDIGHVSAKPGQRIDLGDGAEITVFVQDDELAGGNLNSQSIVLRVTMGKAAFLLTGDIDKEAESRLLDSGLDLRSSVLKVAHHGSKTSTSEAFLQSVDPSIGMISAGADNGYGHPAPIVLDRLRDDLVLRTDLHGDISISTDGSHLWVDTQRE
jgi:competence protein ComEC